MVLKLLKTFVIVSTILASPTRRAFMIRHVTRFKYHFTGQKIYCWSYRSSIYGKYQNVTPYTEQLGNLPPLCKNIAGG